MISTTNNLQTLSAPVLVAGLGLTGWSVVRYLAAQGQAIEVTDSRTLPPYLSNLKNEFPDIPFTPNLPEQEFSRFSEIVASPGIPVTSSHTIGDIELFARAAKAPIIAITGSNGKSTVTMLVAEILKAGGYRVEVGGNIGTPALDLLKSKSPQMYVLELSSFQLDTTQTLAPRAAVVLNISEDHMDRYSSISEYIASKHQIYDNARAIVLNRDDPIASNYSSEVDRVSFGLDQPETGQLGIIKDGDQRFFALGGQKMAPVSAMTLRGEQNVSNILAAMALISACDISIDESMIAAAMSYRGLPHRCELVGQWGGVSWINDSKGTNVGATLAAIQGANKPLLLIAGGQGKGADFSPLSDAVKNGVRKVFVFGEDADLLWQCIVSTVSCEIVDSLESAIDKAAAEAVANDTVLFSPACASFDMFDSYTHRGEVFARLVQEANNAG